MNDVNQTSVATKLHPGRLYVALGVLVPLAALAVYALQLHYNVLKAPWYVPVLGTVGFVSLLMALAQSRSVWRWTATVLVALLVGGEWVSIHQHIPENHLIDALGGLSFLVAGLVALDRRPGNAIGRAS